MLWAVRVRFPKGLRPQGGLKVKGHPSVLPLDLLHGVSRGLTRAGLGCKISGHDGPQLGHPKEGELQEPLTIVVESTPNPNTIRFVINRTLIEQGSEFYDRPPEGEKCLIARKLFEVKGIASLFFIKNFVSLTREPARPWEEVLPKVEEVLRRHYG